MIIVIVVGNRNEQIQNLALPFPVNYENRHLTFGRYDDLTWPGPALEASPNNHFVVVDDRMFYFILYDCISDFC